MYINKFNGFFRNEAGGDSDNGGGTPKGGGIPLVGDSSVEDKSDNSGESDESNDLDSDSDISLFNLLHKITPDGRRGRSELGEGIKALDEKDPKEKDTSKESRKKESPLKEATREKDSKESSTEEELTDEQLLSLDPSKITNSDGRPISVKAAATFNKLKGKLEKVIKEKQELEQKATQLTDNEEFKKVQEERDRLKAEMDARYFEESDGFKETFVTPLNEAVQSVQEYFADADDDVREVVTPLFKKAGEMARTGNKKGFNKILDQICDECIGEGLAVKNAFISDMTNWYDKLGSFAKAHTMKDQERKKYVETHLANQRKKNALSFDAEVDSTVEKFSATKAPIIEHLPEEGRKQYTQSYKDRAEKVKKALGQFSVTGALNDDLKSIINEGVTAGAIQQENQIAWQAYTDAVNKYRQVEDENKELKAKLKKFTREPNESSSGRYTPKLSDDSPVKNHAKSILGEAISQRARE